MLSTFRQPTIKYTFEPIEIIQQGNSSNQKNKVVVGKKMLSRMEQKLSSYDRRMLVIGIYVLRRNGNEYYYWCFRLGLKLKYIGRRLSYYGNNRTRMCRDTAISILRMFERAKMQYPLEFFVFRDAHIDFVHSELIEEEFNGIESGIDRVYKFKRMRSPKVTIIKLVEGNHRWGDFTLAGFFGLPPTTYFVSVYQTNVNMLDLIGLTIALTNGTGYVRVCLKAKSYPIFRTLYWVLTYIIGSPAFAAFRRIASIVRILVVYHTYYN